MYLQCITNNYNQNLFEFYFSLKRVRVEYFRIVLHFIFRNKYNSYIIQFQNCLKNICGDRRNNYLCDIENCYIYSRKSFSHV